MVMFILQTHQNTILIRVHKNFTTTRYEEFWWKENLTVTILCALKHLDKYDG
jgi:hypothetical protein